MPVDIEEVGVTAELELINASISSIPADPGAPFETDVIAALRLVREADPAEYQRIRQRLKKSSISITALERLVNAGTIVDESTVADDLMNLVNDRLDLFHTAENKKEYASFDVDRHRETHAIYSKSFGEWLAMISYRENNSVPSENAISTALRGLAGQAKFDGEERSVYLRVADFEDGYLLDLGDQDWRAIHVTNCGWEVVKSPPIRFWRTQSMMALPIPKSGSYERLWEFVNVQPEDKILLLAFILDCWRNNTQFVILELIGEQGTAKSTTQENIRLFIDPTEVMLRAAPKNREDLFVSARVNWLASYNNMSHIKPEMQDAFCILSTGGGNAGRKFYTDDEENSYNVMRPVMVNGINAVASAADMLDRVIRMELPPLNTFRTDSEMKAELKKAAPEILGGLLDLFSKTLSLLPGEKGRELHDRMADFIQLGQAMLRALSIEGDFEKIFKEKKYETFTHAMEASAACNALIEYMADTPNGFEGTFKSLLNVLEDMVPRHAENWPRSPKGLSDLLHRNAPALRAVGIGIKFYKTRKKDGYHLKVFFLPISEAGEQSTPSSPSTEKQVENAHGELDVLVETTSDIGTEKNVFIPAQYGKQPDVPDSEIFIA